MQARNIAKLTTSIVAFQVFEFRIVWERGRKEEWSSCNKCLLIRRNLEVVSDVVDACVEFPVEFVAGVEFDGFNVVSRSQLMSVEVSEALGSLSVKERCGWAQLDELRVTTQSLLMPQTLGMCVSQDFVGYRGSVVPLQQALGINRGFLRLAQSKAALSHLRDLRVVNICCLSPLKEIQSLHPFPLLVQLIRLLNLGFTFGDRLRKLLALVLNLLLNDLKNSQHFPLYPCNGIVGEGVLLIDVLVVSE